MLVIELEKHPSGEGNGGAALVVADTIDQALALVGWKDATVNTILDYQGSRRLPWIVAQYDGDGLQVHPAVCQV